MRRLCVSKPICRRVCSRAHLCGEETEKGGTEKKNFRRGGVNNRQACVIDTTSFSNDILFFYLLVTRSFVVLCFVCFLPYNAAGACHHTHRTEAGGAAFRYGQSLNDVPVLL